MQAARKIWVKVSLNIRILFHLLLGLFSDAAPKIPTPPEKNSESVGILHAPAEIHYTSAASGAFLNPEHPVAPAST